jgi:PAS domain S-box-containing protein
MRIRNKIIISLFLTALLPFFGMLGFIHYSSAQQIERSGAAAEARAIALIDAVERDLENAVSEVQAWITGSDIAKVALQTETIPAGELDERWKSGAYLVSREAESLKKLQRIGSGRFAEIFVTDPRGNVIAATNPTSDFGQGPDADPPRGETWWAEAREHKLRIGDLSWDESAGKYSVDISVELARDGRFAGVLKAVYQVETLLEILDKSLVGRSGHAVLVDVDGNVIAAPHNLAEIIFDESSNVSDLQASRRTKDNGAGFTIESVPWAGQSLVGVARDASPDKGLKLDWSAFVIMPVDEALLQARQLFWFGALVLLAASLIATVAGILLSIRISKPLVEIANVVSQIEGGALGVQVPHEGEDEVGRLSKAINRMTARLAIYDAIRVDELRQQRLLLENVINHIPAAVFWKDRELRFLGCNNAFANIAGLQTPDDIIGKCDVDMPWTEAQTQGSRDCDQEIVEQRRPLLNVEEQLRDPTGRERTVLTSKVPLLNVDNDVVGMIGIFQDISSRKLLEAQLAQAQKLESIGQLAAGIAHEINTPMQCVGGNVEFLKGCYERLFQVVDNYRTLLVGPDMSWSQRKCEMDRLITDCRYDHLRTQAPAAIEEAADAVQRVIEIVRAMKAMSHPGTAGKVSTNINQLIQNAAAISKNRWKYSAEIAFHLSEPLPDVKALPAELSQVFLNLIVNASDAIVEKNGENNPTLGRITISSRADRDGVQIDVTDDGNGIPAAVQQRIFDPFFTTKDVGKGTGQGLAITYDVVVNKHGGVIDVESKVGEGTTFSIWLPCAPSSSPDAQFLQKRMLQTTI